VVTKLAFMPNPSEAKLSQTFSALSDPTRRAILARLEQEPGLSISDLARPFSQKLPAIMKHLDVLSDAGLISRTKAGRTVFVELAPASLKSAATWLRRYERFWSPRLDRLAAYAEREEAKTTRHKQ